MVLRPELARTSPNSRSGAARTPGEWRKGHSVFQASGWAEAIEPFIAKFAYAFVASASHARHSRKLPLRAQVSWAALASDETSGLTAPHHAVSAGVESAFIQGRAADSSGRKFTSY